MYLFIFIEPLIGRESSFTGSEWALNHENPGLFSLVAITWDPRAMSTQFRRTAVPANVAA